VLRRNIWSQLAVAVTPRHDENGKRILDAREFRFIEEYVAGSHRTVGNAFRSAIEAGYTRSTAEVHSGAWVRSPENGGTKPWVYEEIQRRRDELKDRAIMSADEVLSELTKLARSNAKSFAKVTSDGDVYIDPSEMTADDWAAVSEVQVEDYKEGRGEDARDVKKIKLKNYDKRAALESLSKVYGLQKTVHSNDPKNPMPGVTVNAGVQYDLTKLTLAEIETLHALLKKATPDQPPVAQRPAV
jgi:phage terminase small subunit